VASKKGVSKLESRESGAILYGVLHLHNVRRSEKGSAINFLRFFEQELRSFQQIFFLQWFQSTQVRGQCVEQLGVDNSILVKRKKKTKKNLNTEQKQPSSNPTLMSSEKLVSSSLCPPFLRW
jgi:hypothetical protein